MRGVEGRRWWRPRASSWLRPALVLTVVVAGLWAASRGVAGVGWREVWGAVSGVSGEELVTLGLIWLAGLVIYSVVLAAAMPGLGMPRGLLLNLTGSAVANVLPLGGALATALNWRMLRSWGHSDAAFVAFTVLTNALDVLTKLLLPLVAVATLVALSRDVPALLWVATAACAAALALALVVREVLRRHGGRPPSRFGRWAGRLDSLLRESGTRIAVLVRTRWRRLLPASVAYVAAQVLLLGVALHDVGLTVPVASLLTAAAIERLGTVAGHVQHPHGSAPAGSRGRASRWTAIQLASSTPPTGISSATRNTR